MAMAAHQGSLKELMDGTESQIEGREQEILAVLTYIIL
jgi:hypothetical protein